MAKESKTEWLGRALDWFDRAGTWWPALMWAAGGAGLTAWAARATKALDAYKPLSWVIASTLGAVLFTFIYWIWTAARLRSAKTRFYSLAPALSGNVNPLDTSFEKRRIDVFGFRNPVNHVVADKLFSECEMVGDGGVAVFTDSTFSTQTPLDFFKCDFIVLRSDKDNFNFNNITLFEHCTFRRCKFFNLVMGFNQTSADMFGSLGWRIPWLTRNPPAALPGDSEATKPPPPTPSAASATPEQSA